MCACVITIDLHGESVAPHDLQNALDLVAGIDHHGFARRLVAENRAVALQHSDRKNLVDHMPIVYSLLWATSSVR